MLQFSATHRTNSMTDIVTELGTTPFLLLYTGAPPANCAAAATGTLLASLPGANPAGTVSAGVLTFSAFTQENAVAAGIAGYYRLCTSSAGTTCIEQGLVEQTTTIATSAATAADGNILTFTATTGVVVGMTVSGTGVAAGATVLAVTSTTVTMSATSSAGVASGASITFGGDLSMVNTNIASGQPVSVTSWTITAAGA